MKLNSVSNFRSEQQYFPPVYETVHVTFIAMLSTTKELNISFIVLVFFNTILEKSPASFSVYVIMKLDHLTKTEKEKRKKRNTEKKRKKSYSAAQFLI